MGEISNGFPNNSVNGAGASGEGASPGRCSVWEQLRPGHPATARLKWSKEANKVVRECYFRSKPVKNLAGKGKRR